MAYNTIFARSFTKHDQKKLRYGAFVGCLMIVLSICTVFKPDLNPIPSLNLMVPVGFGLKNMLMTEEIIKPRHIDAVTEESKSNLEPKSMNIKTEEMKPILEPKPMDIKTDDIKQKPSRTLPKLAATTIEEKNVLPIIVEPIQTDENKLSHDVSNSKPTYINPVPTVSNPISKEIQTDALKKITIQKEKIGPICNTSMPRTDVCEIKGDIRIDGKSATVYLNLPNTVLLPEKNSWSIKPYARKEDKTAMEGVREFKVRMVNSPQEIVPQCSHNHSVVGIVFSTNGYVGNHFHDFTDTIIPLYITSREFNGEVKFVVTNKNRWWINKYKHIFQKLSKYEAIDIDKENEVHCFPKMIVGLKQHKELDVDSSRSQHSMGSFRQFLREAYSLKKQKAIKFRTGNGKKSRAPRLLVVSRKNTRAFLNEAEIKDMAKNMGFEVVVAEADSNEARFAKIVNSCDVMMGVHGAGLTNILYLPDKAVFIQILGLGNMEWLARKYFGEPSKSMNLRYFEYQIGLNESSLIQQYPLDHPVFRDPQLAVKGWLAYRQIYLIKQNVNLDVNKFRGTLQEALKVLHQ